MFETSNISSKQSIERNEKLLSFCEIATDANLNDEKKSEIFLQSKIFQITFDKLLEQVKGIYGRLVMFESTCTDIHEETYRRRSRSHKQWQRLIKMHKYLITEHYDLYIVCQHFSENSNLRHLIISYKLPARMWRHGIYSSLKILRESLSEIFDHMWAFMIFVYSMLTLFHETTSVFHWMKCLENLGRYMIMMQNIYSRERNVYETVFRFWYQKTLDEYSNEKKLYYHLNIFTHSRSLQKLFYIVIFMICKNSFQKFRMNALNFVSIDFVNQMSTQFFVRTFIQIHKHLFFKNAANDIKELLHEISVKLLDYHIERITTKFKEDEVFVAIACIVRFFEYRFSEESSSKFIFRHAFEKVQINQLDQMQNVSQSSKFIVEILTSFDIRRSQFFIYRVFSLAFDCLSIALRRTQNKNIFSLIHVYLIFFRSFATVEKIMTCVEQIISWFEICSLLNILIQSNDSSLPCFEKDFFVKNIDRSLFENFIIRSQMYGQSYFSNDWFKNIVIDDEKRSLKTETIMKFRTEKILWFEFCFAFVCLNFLCNVVTWLKLDRQIDKSLLIINFRLSRSYGMTQNLFELLRHHRQRRSGDVAMIEKTKTEQKQSNFIEWTEQRRRIWWLINSSFFFLYLSFLFFFCSFTIVIIFLIRTSFLTWCSKNTVTEWKLMAKGVCKTQRHIERPMKMLELSLMVLTNLFNSRGHHQMTEMIKWSDQIPKSDDYK